MALVDYGSSDSEQDQVIPSAPLKNRTTNATKPVFEKLVDKSNPGKIRVSLETGSAKVAQEDEIMDQEPQAKRIKTGNSGGFNSFLPAPKRTPGMAGGLRKGISLKTGAAPGFTREPVPETSSYDPSHEGDPEATLDEAVSAKFSTTDGRGVIRSGEPQVMSTDGDIKKKTVMFKPLSVARKPQKKRSEHIDGQRLAASTSKEEALKSNSVPKMSLFSVGDAADSTSIPSSSSGSYQPLLYIADTSSESKLSSTDTWDEERDLQRSVQQPPTIPLTQADSLDSISADLNLSASARRQLLGRNQRDSKSTSIKIKNFNTDQEYAANEVMRQSGEILQHNAVRGIAPGKHSLKQLVNAATSQKDALEEQFAAGRRNKSEAGTKYGW